MKIALFFFLLGILSAYCNKDMAGYTCYETMNNIAICGTTEYFWTQEREGAIYLDDVHSIEFYKGEL